jgi:hypothetical protein
MIFSGLRLKTVRGSAFAGSLLLLCLCQSVRADISIVTSLNSAVTISASSGTVSFGDRDSISGLTGAFYSDTNGGYILQYDPDGGNGPLPLTVTSTGSYGTATGTAHQRTVTGGAADLSISGASFVEAYSAGVAGISGTFEILNHQATPTPVDVTFTAVLTGEQNLSTSGLGVAGTSGVAFDLYLGNGFNLLSYQNEATVGANQTSDFTISNATIGGPLTDTVSLYTNTFYSYTTDVVTASDGMNAPEPGDWLPLAAGLPLLFVFRRLRGVRS